MKSKIARTAAGVFLALLVAFSMALLMEYPPLYASAAIPGGKPIILYYDYENLPFQPAQFAQIVNTTLLHHFNTLMLLVFYDSRPIFNASIVQYFFEYSKSRGLAFVPSFYITSTSDRINISGFPWVNLDMEHLSTEEQLSYFWMVSSIKNPSSLVSVTSPHGQLGQRVSFGGALNIVETYSNYPNFWFMQLTYPHSYHACSVGVFLLKTQQQYDEEKNYCLRYSDGVMVFDYSSFIKSGFN